MAEEISDKEKVRIASHFLLHSPPGEFNEVFNDVRVLMANDAQLREGAAWAVAQYNKEQLTPVLLENSDYPGMVSNYNDLGHGRFADPRSKQSFKFDHLRRECSDLKSWSSDASMEELRSAIEQEVTEYALNHYPHGVCAVFAVADKEEKGNRIVVCIEDHHFQPKNFWNGRWRSVWSVYVGGAQARVEGLLRVQVHYYEDGNVQLVSSKEVNETISLTNETSAAKELVQLMSSSESSYQSALSENYQTMSEATFKALRRLLPVTRTKLEWNKIVSYSIGHELQANQ